MLGASLHRRLTRKHIPHTPSDTAAQTTVTMHHDVPEHEKVPEALAVGAGVAVEAVIDKKRTCADAAAASDAYACAVEAGVEGSAASRCSSPVYSVTISEVFPNDSSAV